MKKKERKKRREINIRKNVYIIHPRKGVNINIYREKEEISRDGKKYLLSRSPIRKVESKHLYI